VYFGPQRGEDEKKTRAVGAPPAPSGTVCVQTAFSVARAGSTKSVP
jgi:hypothetical protein